MEYLINKDAHWEETNLRCGRDNGKIYREIKNNGDKTNHFCCARSGCTWTTYYSNVKELLKTSDESK